MKTGTLFVAALALATLPLAAQQMPQSNTQPNSPAAQQSAPPAQPGAVPEQTTTPEQPATPAARPETSAVPETSAAPAATAAEMSPVNGELVSKLDTKTAKTGDDVVVQTKSAVKTADGTEIPKGSKLMGHVLAVQASSGGQNSQVVLKFDHAELTGGQSLPIHSEIRSIGSSESASASGAMSGPATSSPSSPSSGAAPGGGMNGSSSAATPQSAPGGAMGAGTGVPAAGTIVARNGNIAISTTSVPGVLLANNAPGQQDPRMAQASSILLGAKKDVQLDGGTPVVVGVSADNSGGAMK